MPRARSPNREKAENLWLESDGSKPLVEIASELGVGASQIRKWKNQDSWEQKLEDQRKGNVTNPDVGSKGNVTIQQRPGAPARNQNATGNPGGKGAPKGNDFAKGNPGGGPPLRNQNAFRTGEHVSLWEDELSESEREKLDRVDTNPLAQFESAVRLYEYREMVIMQQIKRIEAGLSEKGRRVLQELQKIKQPVTMHDEKTGQTRTISVDKHELVVTEIEETEVRKIDDLLNLGEALTRTTERKVKASKEIASFLAGQEKLALAREKLALDREKTKAEIDKLKGGADVGDGVTIIDDIGSDDDGA